MRAHFNLNSLTTRLILMGVFLILAGALGRVLLLSDMLRKDVTELASSQLVALAQYVAQDVDRDIKEREDFLKLAANKFPLPLLKNPQQLRAWLSNRHDINPLFSKGILVINTSGMSLSDYPILPNRVGAIYADRDYFQQAITGQFAIGRPSIGSLEQVPVLPMATPILDSSGKVQAVLVGISELQSPNFLESLYSTHIGLTGGLLLISPQEKLFIGSSDASMILQPTPNISINKLHDRAMNGFRGAGITVNAKGIEELAAFASVPSSGWFVVARLPTKEALASVTGLQRFIQRNTLILVPVFLILIILVLRRLMRPLMNAAEHADKMTQGLMPFEPLPVVRNDEVGHLTTAFNRLLSKLLESRAELEHIAHHDSLTKLPNRQLLTDRMNQALARVQRNRGQVAVLVLDLDGFKPINDEWGHSAGDAALCEVASRLSEIVRREDTLARVGGDEFVILLSDLNESAKDTAELVANKCLAAFQQPFIIHGQSLQLGTSIGIAIGSSECKPDRLLIVADHAMYQAKQAGRSQFLLAEVCATCSVKIDECVCGITKDSV